MTAEQKPTEFIHNRLKYYRNINGLTQRQVAAALGIDRSTYTYYETGRSNPNLDILSKVCSIYRIDISCLLNSEETYQTVGDSSVNSSPSDKIETTTDDSSQLSLNQLTRDEQNLILKFRLYTKKQREELLCSLGVKEKKQSDNNS